MINITQKASNLLKTLSKKLPRYLDYFNFLILAAVLVWSYFFIQHYFLKTKDDFKFIKDNIGNISYTKLNSDEFSQIYQAYQDKLNYKMEVSEDLRSPF
jgi:hypothetical protein